MSQALTDEDWKRAADSAYREANNEASFYGLNVFVEVFDDGRRRYEARGTHPPEGAEEAVLRARIAELKGQIKEVWGSDLMSEEGPTWQQHVAQLEAKLQALEAKETARNAARLAELASGTVPRTEYDAMVKQRDTIRQERTEARDERDGLRSVLGDVLYDLLEMQKDPEHGWHLEEAIWQLEGATERKGPLSKSPTPMPPPEAMALITEGMQQVMTTLTNIERPGELARIYSALDAIQTHLDDLVEDWQAQGPAERD